MPIRFATIAVCFAGIIPVCGPATAAPLPVCNTTFTVCGIPENTLVQFPGLAISGDLVLLEPGSATVVSDVFRIFNNIFDTGHGTGLGNMGFLYSLDDSSLPDPSTYSANVTFINESPTGVTSFVNNGTTYLLGAPEPGTYSYVLLTILAILWRRFTRKLEGEL
jgi:hypothetical protein